MTGVRLPDGGKAWFVRHRKSWGCGMRPVSTEGRLLTGAYAGWIGVLSWFFADHDLDTLMVALWITLILTSTFLYLVTALRMSASSSESGQWRSGCS